MDKPTAYPQNAAQAFLTALRAISTSPTGSNSPIHVFIFNEN